MPPYLTREAVEWLVEKRIEHLVLDVPSLDRTHDEGHLVGHRLFFGLPPGSTARGDAARSRATITELAFVPDELHDGPCVLALAVPAIGGRCRSQPADCVSSGAMNASPSDVGQSGLNRGDVLPQFSMSRDFALDSDAADILAPYRKQFELPVNASGQPLNYLCGHSLGLAPRAALDYVSEELADWAVARRRRPSHRHAPVDRLRAELHQGPART